MRKQELDNWVKTGGDLPDNLTEDEKSYLKGLGWEVSEYCWSTGQRSCERHLLHRKKHGKEQGWCPNGRKSYQCYWLHGEKHGMFRTWNVEGGQMAHDECYHRGKKHGVWRKWDVKGTLTAHKEYAYGILLKDFLK